MKTHEQQTGQVDEATRAFTKALADLCRRDPAQFSAMVRAGDQMRACGVPELEIRRLILEAIS